MSSDLLGMLQESLGGGAVQQMSRAIGADEDQTSAAIAGALPVLLSALSRNTASAGGAESLLSALDRDHDGSILDDLAGFMGHASSSSGDAILGHVLGGRRSTVENGLSRMSGLDPASMAKLLAMLAPIVMAALGKAQRSRGLDSGGLTDLLAQERSQVKRAAPDAMSAFERLLDTDDDGQVMDNVAEIGGSLLNAFFKRLPESESRIQRLAI